jgi:hypothetical protein
LFISAYGQVGQFLSATSFSAPSLSNTSNESRRKFLVFPKANSRFCAFSILQFSNFEFFDFRLLRNLVALAAARLPYPPPTAPASAVVRGEPCSIHAIVRILYIAPLRAKASAYPCRTS